MTRMLDVRLLSEKFKIPASFDFKKLTGSHFGVHWTDDQIKVEVRFEKSVAGYIKERRWHSSQQIEDQADGGTVLTLTVNHLLELKRWILSWGGQAEVLAPEGFVADIQKTIAEMKSIYG